MASCHSYQLGDGMLAMFHVERYPRIMKKLLALLLLPTVLLAANNTTVTETPGTTTTVYRGTGSIGTTPDYATCKAAATADAATRKPGTYSYGCQDARDKLSIKVTVPVPPPVVEPPIVIPPPVVTPPPGSPILAPPGGPVFNTMRIQPYTGTDPPVPGDVGAFRNPCNYSHMLFDDPIKFPGIVGGSHAHTYFGNPTLNANSTLASLLAADLSTCAGGIANESSYWIPSVVDLTTNRALVPFENIIYYKSGYNAPPRLSLVAPPNGLKIIAGNYMTTSGPVWAAPFEYRCNGVYDPALSWEDRQKIPACAPGSYLEIIVTYPNCWNGQLEATDFERRNNMAYAVDNACPASHSIGLPTISMNIKYWIAAGMKLRLSSDMYDANLPAGYSMHMDLFVAWDRATVDTWMNFCVKASMNCHGFLLGDGRTTY